jgi:hypothetical protein
LSRAAGAADGTMTERTAHRGLGHGPLLWFALVGGLAAWIAHVGIEITLAAVSHGRPNVIALMNAATVATALVAILSMVAGFAVVRSAGWRPGHDEAIGASDVATTSARIYFLGWFAVAMGAINLVLIVAEGLYVVYLPGHG